MLLMRINPKSRFPSSASLEPSVNMFRWGLIALLRYCSASESTSPESVLFTCSLSCHSVILERSLHTLSCFWKIWLLPPVYSLAQSAWLFAPYTCLYKHPANSASLPDGLVCFVAQKMFQSASVTFWDLCLTYLNVMIILTFRTSLFTTTRTNNTSKALTVVTLQRMFPMKHHTSD